LVDHVQGVGVPAKKSVTTEASETVSLSSPTSGNYFVVVNNALGVNSGYSLTVTSVYRHGERPAELDGVAGAVRPPAPANPSPLADGSFAPELPSVPVPQAGVSVPGLVGVQPVDPDLAGLPSDLSPGAANDIFRDGDTATGPREPVSGLTVAVWAGLLPVLLVGAALFALYRRRPRALTVGTGPAVTAGSR
jgi:hypothetical protein